MVWLPVFGIVNVRTGVDACHCTQGLYGHRKGVCTGSGLEKKKKGEKYFRTGDSNPRQCALLCGVVSIESMKLGRILGRSVPFSSFISPVAFQVSSKRSFLQTVMSVAWKVANSSRRSPEAPDGCRHGDIFMK